MDNELCRHQQRTQKNFHYHSRRQHFSRPWCRCLRHPRFRDAMSTFGGLLAGHCDEHHEVFQHLPACGFRADAALRVMVPRKNKARTNFLTSTAGSQSQLRAAHSADSDCLRWMWESWCGPCLFWAPLHATWPMISITNSIRWIWWTRRSWQWSSGLMMGNQNFGVTVLQVVLHPSTPCSTATSEVLVSWS